jgi:hypothetical protein
MDDFSTSESVTSEPTSADGVAESGASSTLLSDARMSAEMSRVFDAAETRDPSETPEPRYEAQYEAPQAPRTATRPQSLSPTAQPHWDRTPAEMQQWIAEREHQSTQKINELGQQLGELRRAGSTQSAGSADFGDVLQRFDSVIPRMPDGQPVPVNALLEESLTLAAMLRGSPEERALAIHTVARQAGMDLNQLAHDPQAAAQREQAIAQHAWQSAQAQFAQQQQQTQMARAQHLTSAVHNFSADKPYWGEIEGAVLGQIEAIKATEPWRLETEPMAVLKQAHDEALKLTGVGDKLPDRQAAAKKKADEAKRLASLNVRSSTGRSPRNISKDIWSSENWGDIYDRVANR